MPRWSPGLLLTPAMAHHSAAMFDDQVELTLTENVVTRFDYLNPHSWLYVNVDNDDGSQTEWGFELGAPPRLRRSGISPNFWQPGDAGDDQDQSAQGRPARRKSARRDQRRGHDLRQRVRPDSSRSPLSRDSLAAGDVLACKVRMSHFPATPRDARRLCDDLREPSGDVEPDVGLTDEPARGRALERDGDEAHDVDRCSSLRLSKSRIIAIHIGETHTR